MSLHLSKCHIVGNCMSGLNYIVFLELCRHITIASAAIKITETRRKESLVGL